MIRIVRKHRAVLPKLYLPDSLLQTIGKIIEGNIIDNIARQKQTTGAPLKRNAPTTVRRKQRLGQAHLGRILSLVALLRRFVQPMGRSWKTIISRKTDKSVASLSVVPATAELASLVGYVQKNGYTGWFGTNKEGRAAIRSVIRDWTKAQFRSHSAKV